jgi:uncharacterized protein (TIGR03435 family)
MMLKRVNRAGLISLFASSLALAQTPAFEVASIRPVSAPRPPSPDDEGVFCPFGCRFGSRLKVVGLRVDIAFMALDELIVRAYRLKAHQLLGPDWMRDQKFDILANIPTGASPAQVPEMLQALLADRFKLTAHRETRDQPVYALLVDKSGSKLKASTQASIPNAPGDRTPNSPQGPVNVRDIGGEVMVTSGPWGPMKMRLESKGPAIDLLGVTMPLFADVLTQFMDRPVIDMTNLKGAYEVSLLPDDMLPFLAKHPPVAPNDDGKASDPTGSSTIFKSMEKVGLKLERTKAPIETLVIDRLEKLPTEN